MLEFDALKSLFNHLKVKHTPNKYWMDGNGWQIVEHMHKVVLNALNAKVEASQFLSISCNEVTNIDSRQCMCINVYMMKNFTQWMDMYIYMFMQ